MRHTMYRARYRTVRHAVLLIAMASAAVTTHAQGTRDTVSSVHDTAQVVAPAGHLVHPRDAFVFGAFALATAVALPNDRHIADAFQRPGVQRSTTLRRAAAVFRYTGQPGVLVGGVAAYAVGRATQRPALARAGLRTTEALVVTGTLTSIAKAVTGRARPPVAAGGDPYDFGLWRGREQGYTSMPSGHTSAAFAAATALSAEWKRSLPEGARYAVPALYAGATLVGLSRMYNNRHWASDVVAGAALGILGGQLVDRWGRARPPNALDRWLLPLSIAPGANGSVRVGFTLPAHAAISSY